MMMDYYQIFDRIPLPDSLKILEADIHHANVLAASIPRRKGDLCLQMKLVYNHSPAVCLLLLQWLDCSCASLLSSYLNLFHIVIYEVSSDGKPKISSFRRKATVREFYSVILPSLQHIHGNTLELDMTQESGHYIEMVVKKRLEDRRKVSLMDTDREDECGICLEPCTKIVVPSCCHAMCINCYHDWNKRSESCPFCRGSMKRVSPGDLWVLTCSRDVVDSKTVLKEDMLRFYVFINSLPNDIPDAVFLMYYEYLI